ncbi:LURP-one-related/scramblase family protein [Streptomyces boninensis]|uniref:LURP-one-related/scramblase family protein n=1 Tax=Streptomyces boninensis TaxID=2039455 RepID=UPI003B2195F5
MKYLVRERLLDIGHDSWVEDEYGEKAFHVDGKIARLRDTLELQDPDGTVAALVKQRLASLRPAMTIERDGQLLCTVKKKRITLLRERFYAKLVTGEVVDVVGSILNKEYDIEYGGERLARISRRWTRYRRLRDVYAVDVRRADADAALLIAIAICVDRMVEKERAGASPGI